VGVEKIQQQQSQTHRLQSARLVGMGVSHAVRCVQACKPCRPLHLLPSAKAKALNAHCMCRVMQKNSSRHVPTCLSWT
jgi:hypothetical protein